MNAPTTGSPTSAAPSAAGWRDAAFADLPASDAPDADIPLDHELTSRLVATQHPQFSGALRLVASGWDNAIFRLGEDYAVRMPRRRIAATLISTEQRWLPELAPRLGVPIPVPVALGVPSEVFPYPWSIVRWLPGVQAASVPAAERSAAAEGLADFVHAFAVPAPADAPNNPYRGVPLVARDAAMRTRLAALDPGLGPIWEDSLAAAPWSGDPVWVHGDLHPGNLLLDADGALAAVIDFGDLTAGDPATDLATAWLSFDRDGRTAFRESLAGLRVIDDASWRRARGWALVLASAIVESTSGDGPIARLGRHGLEQVLEGQ